MCMWVTSHDVAGIFIRWVDAEICILFLFLFPSSAIIRTRCFQDVRPSIVHTQLVFLRSRYIQTGSILLHIVYFIQSAVCSTCVWRYFTCHYTSCCFGFFYFFHRLVIWQCRFHRRTNICISMSIRVVSCLWVNRSFRIHAFVLGSLRYSIMWSDTCVMIITLHTTVPQAIINSIYLFIYTLTDMVICK